MGLRLRRSIRLGPGVRMNLGLHGVGLSAGVRGLRYSVHSSGRRTASVGIPGTGMSYVTSLKGSSRPRTVRRAATTTVRAPAAPAVQKKPGLFAPGYEKEFARGVTAYLEGATDRALNLFRKASGKDTANRAVADDLLIGILELQAGRAGPAISFLEKVAMSKIALPDELLRNYLPYGAVELAITPRVRAAIPWSSLLGALALAEAYQVEGRVDEAIGVLQQIAGTRADPALTLSLCELLSSRESWKDVIELSAGVANEDDLSLQIKLFQARALERTGLPDAALDAYRDCLRSKKRDPNLLLHARYARGRLLLELGRKTAALRDLGTVYAEDPQFEDLATLIARAQSGPGLARPQGVSADE